MSDLQYRVLASLLLFPYTDYSLMGEEVILVTNEAKVYQNQQKQHLRIQISTTSSVVKRTGGRHEQIGRITFSHETSHNGSDIVRGQGGEGRRRNEKGTQKPRRRI